MGIFLLAFTQISMTVMFITGVKSEERLLKWNPDPRVDGLKAFQHVEDDRAHSDPGVKHIYVSEDYYRFDMPLMLRDIHKDRQRNEVFGMADHNGKIVNIVYGEKWTLEWSIFIPTSLTGTTSFSDIFQMIKPGGPSMTIMVHREKDPSIPHTLELLNILGGRVKIGSTPLEPLQNKWIKSHLTFSSVSNGTIEWIVTDEAGKEVVHAVQEHQKLWVKGLWGKPKWGLYRSITHMDQIQSCHVLMKDFKAWKFV